MALTSDVIAMSVGINSTIGEGAPLVGTQSFSQFIAFGDSTIDSGYFFTHPISNDPTREAQYQAADRRLWIFELYSGRQLCTFSGEQYMAKRRRRAWTKKDVAELKAHSKSRTPVVKISKVMKRTVGALRRKAGIVGIRLGHRR